MAKCRGGYSTRRRSLFRALNLFPKRGPVTFGLDLDLDLDLDLNLGLDLGLVLDLDLVWALILASIFLHMPIPHLAYREDCAWPNKMGPCACYDIDRGHVGCVARVCDALGCVWYMLGCCNAHAMRLCVWAKYGHDLGLASAFLHRPIPCPFREGSHGTGCHVAGYSFTRLKQGARCLLRPIEPPR